MKAASVNKIHIWSLKTNEQQKKMSRTASTVRSLALGPPGALFCPISCNVSFVTHRIGQEEKG